ALSEAAHWLAAHGISGGAVQAMTPVIHGFTHFELHLVPLRVAVDTHSALAAESSLHWQPRADVTSAALPAPVRRLLEALDD
ncbi:NUDIX domain-containing protein, partial [Acinetobacter baumannii]